jgi:hypothetical protein
MAKKAATVGFSEDIAAQVCGLISEGLSLRKIEMKEGMPSKVGILKRLLEGDAYKASGQPTHRKALFVDPYARTREFQADCLRGDRPSDGCSHRQALRGRRRRHPRDLTERWVQATPLTG